MAAPLEPPYVIERGRQHPLGATPDADGVNFAVFAQHATKVELLLFGEHDCPEPLQVIELDPALHRTFFIWHVYVRGLRPGTLYAYRVDGPRDASQGHCYLPRKVLIDPYAKGNSASLWDRVAACGDGDNTACSMRSVVIDTEGYDWEGDEPLRRPMSETIVYEMHVGGFTRGTAVAHPGTFRGVVERIPYLKELGVTAVELLPVFEFDDSEILRLRDDGTALRNYWGYSTLGFFAPDDQYCVSPHLGQHVSEFRDMVKALHKAGIEVILDVVFNHTNEGNHLGPVISFKGFDSLVYYYHVPGQAEFYYDYTGCGNTFNCNHPVVEKLILDSLRYWVEEMHVDGFRFDEGSVLTRGEDGAPLPHPPVIWAIELDEALADTKVIAEAWDAAGLYQIGYFPGQRWAEWNGKYRDDVRRFVKGDLGLVGAIAARIAGSADLYQASGRQPVCSVNFVTCHDGFTLNDLVSYNEKHNEANGEGNRDGIDDNLSWNCGAEGPSDDPGLEAFRRRQIKNFAAILLLSQGVPMILGGDEMRRTQGGNNNAYCQDNAVSWFDWDLAEREADLLRFWRELIALRRRSRCLQRETWFTGAINGRGLAEITWHGCELNAPGWGDPSSRVLAFTLAGIDDEPDLHVILNMDDSDLDFAVPPVEGRSWARLVDTGLPSPDDIRAPGAAEPIRGDRVRAGARTVVVLAAGPRS